MSDPSVPAPDAVPPLAGARVPGRAGRGGIGGDGPHRTEGRGRAASPVGTTGGSITAGSTSGVGPPAVPGGRPATGEIPGTVDLAAGFFARYAGTTLRTYQLKLRAYAAWCGVPLPDLPGAVLAAGAARVALDVERYRAHLRDDRGLAPATINGHLAALRALVRFLRRVQACSWTLEAPSERAVAYRDTAGPGLAAIRRLLRAAERHPDPRRVARDVALLRLLVDRALRRGEVVGLDVADVERAEDGTPRAVRVQGKGRRDREPLSLPPKTAAALAAWLAVRGPAPGPLFIALDPGAGRMGREGRSRAALSRLTGEGIAHVLATLAARARLAGPVRPHGLRHTAITALLDAGAGLREVQRFSRHADPRTLMRYDDNRSDLGGVMARRVSDLL